MWNVVDQWLFNTAIYNNSKTVEFDPLPALPGFGSFSVKTNFDAAIANVSQHATFLMEANLHNIEIDGKAVFEALVEQRKEALFARNDYINLLKTASTQSYNLFIGLLSDVNAKVRFGENVETALKIVRDLSATTLLVGVTFLSGGTAVAFLSGGSVFKGFNVWQDTGNVGNAVLTAGSTFITTGIGFASQGAVDAAAKGMLILVSAEIKGFTELAVAQSDPKTTNAVKRSLTSAGLSAAADAIAGQLGIKSMPLKVGWKYTTDAGRSAAAKWAGSSHGSPAEHLTLGPRPDATGGIAFLQFCPGEVEDVSTAEEFVSQCVLQDATPSDVAPLDHPPLFE
jgi:hypothetical protein